MFPKYNAHVPFLINFSPVNERDLSQHLRYQLFLLLLGQIGLKDMINMNNKIFLHINIIFISILAKLFIPINSISLVVFVESSILAFTTDAYHAELKPRPKTTTQGFQVSLLAGTG